MAGFSHCFRMVTQTLADTNHPVAASPGSLACGSWHCGFSRSGDQASAPTWPWRRSAAGWWRVSRSLSTATGASAETSPTSWTWPGPGSVVLNVGTGRHHSVLDMAEAAAKDVSTLHFSGSNFTNFTPSLEHQAPHPADVPETRASLVAVWRELGWQPRIFFPHLAELTRKTCKPRKVPAS
jgi:hypothetical protein